MELSNEPNIDLMICENASTIDAVNESVLESIEFCLLMTCESDDEESDDIGPSDGHIPLDTKKLQVTEDYSHLTACEIEIDPELSPHEHMLITGSADLTHTKMI